MQGSRSSLIAIFARHKIAANLLMLAMIISGLWSLTRINIQFLPSFDLNFVQISILWPFRWTEHDLDHSPFWLQASV